METLPIEEIVSGFAEMLKHGLIADESLFTEIVSEMTNMGELSEDLLLRCIEIKHEIVKEDLNDDFFSVESYPTAKISILDSELISDGKWLVSGELTIKSYTHPIQFEIINSMDGWKADLVFDRSMYDIQFRSGTFFEKLGDKMIYDDIELEINLKTL